MEKNLTTDSVLKTLVGFSLPYLLSYFLQTLYGMADLFMIGQYCKVESITAVSIGSQVMHMITVIIVGLAMGTTVLIGRAVGAGKRQDASVVIGNTVTLFATISIMISAILLVLVRQMIEVMSTPTEAVAGTISYLTICFIGIPLITAYNIISSVFRGLGDSKSPMYFIAIACGANILLDYVFIGLWNMGPSGAALGTVLAQTISVIISLIIIVRKSLGNDIRLSGQDFHPRRNTLSELLKIGIPISLQDGLIQVAFIIITVIANRRGLEDAAAVGIVEKLIGILFLVPSSMLSAVSALSAHNIGANKHDRVRETLKYALMICVIFGIAASIVMQFFAEPFVGLFSDDGQVIRLGGEYMRGYVWDCIFAGIHFCFSGYFCAYGWSNISFIHNLLSIICVRIPVAYFASVVFSETLLPMGLASPAGSLLSVIICLISYVWLHKTHKETFGIVEG